MIKKDYPVNAVTYSRKPSPTHKKNESSEIKSLIKEDRYRSNNTNNNYYFSRK